MSDKAESRAAAPAKGGKGRLFIVIGAVLVLLLGAGGGTWWFTSGDADEKAVKAPPVLPPVFVALEPFTVNLQPEGGGSQYMQVGITVKVSGQAVADRLKLLMPEIRNRMLLTLSSKKASELLVPEGKTLLARELAREIAALLDPAAAAEKKPAITVATAPAETGSDAAEQQPEASAEPAAAESETPAAAAPAPAGDAVNGPVLSVLFTSLIIQ